MSEIKGNGPEDFIDWETFRKTSEYTQYIVIGLERKIANLVIPGFDITKFSSYSAEQQTQLKRIYQVRSVEGLEAYCRENNLRLDVKAEIEQLESEYPASVRLAAEWEPRINAAVEDIFGTGQKRHQKGRTVQ